MVSQAVTLVDKAVVGELKMMVRHCKGSGDISLEFGARTIRGAKRASPVRVY